MICKYKPIPQENPALIFSMLPDFYAFLVDMKSIRKVTRFFIIFLFPVNRLKYKVFSLIFLLHCNMFCVRRLDFTVNNQ